MPEAFHARIWERGENREPTIYRSKAVGEPPLMLAISVHSAINQAIFQAAAAAHPGRSLPALDAPATPERVLMCLHNRGAATT